MVIGNDNILLVHVSNYNYFSVVYFAQFLKHYRLFITQNCL